MSKIRYFFLGALALMLSACKLTVLDPKGIIAADEKNLFIVSLALMLLVVIPVIVLALVFAWRYRAHNAKAKYSPDWSHSSAIEVVCWSVPIVIIFILGVMTWFSSHRLDPYKPLTHSAKPLTIQVVALDWKWLFIYPEQKIATVNYLQFPVNVPIQFHITAEGPMNSFQIPQLGSQIYAMAGMQTRLNLIAEEAGEYQGYSANFSGEGFAGMKFIARATEQNEFDAWVKKVQLAHAGQLDMREYQYKLVPPSQYDPIKLYSTVSEDVFNKIVMKSMHPQESEGPVVRELSGAQLKTEHSGA